ncbi:uncharacterized protein LOC113765363 [Coffea eugenioides]|uniref:uncharacterized protein LOC113765363 n=1 Tax=Coffea eugenioides TaxID=49369 RepID=UPI000F6070C7|nr:uncharacterized protein LOC113765363 [Coffea eugenioides]
MEKSLQIRPRKRKQYYSLKTSSNPFMGRFTRSKSQVHFHQNRSGRTWTDITSDKSIYHQKLLQISPLKKPKRVHYEIVENEAALDLSIKDLRARARRVFSPTTAVVEEENGTCRVGFDFGEENCNGSSKVLENFGDLELGVKGLDPDLGSWAGFGVANQKEGRNEKKESVDPGSRDPEPGTESHGPASKEDEVDLSKITSPVKEKNGFNKVSNSGMILNSLSRRKVFKSPSSFSYRRLLPFLMDMAKDDSGTSRIEIVDKDFSCQVQNLSNVDYTVSSALMDTENAKTKDVGQHIDDNKLLEKRDIENVKNNFHVREQDPNDPNKKLLQTEENVSSFVEGIANENGLARGDKLIEDCVQTTPPDATILSEIHDHDDRANGEINNLKTGNHILGHPANGSMCSNQTFLHENLHRSPRRNNTISMTKMILNPCSRSKIFKTSSSFSYRRLLPFLMDVANSSTNIDQSPNIRKMENDQHSPLLASSNKDAFLNKNEVDIFQEKEAKNDEPCCPIAVKVHSIDGSSDDVCLDLSTPFSSSRSSNGKSNPASSENISQRDMLNCLQVESSSTCTHGQLNNPRDLEVVLPTADFRVCDGETNCLTETSCSAIKDDFLPKGSLLEFSQHEQVDIEKNSLVEGQDNNNSKAANIRSLSLDQYSSGVGVFSFQGTDSSIKGILKRNPRGCRGLCNCLNCAAFRLHAKRAFEFSRNQMLDAEEVALGLIDELAELRNLLEISAVDGSKLGAFPFNKLLVREACQKALKTEQQAKQRLGQMIDDLNVHCRITPLQPPGVTFSRRIEERSIPSRDLSARP